MTRLLPVQRWTRARLTQQSDRRLHNARRIHPEKGAQRSPRVATAKTIGAECHKLIRYKALNLLGKAFHVVSRGNDWANRVF